MLCCNETNLHLSLLESKLSRILSQSVINRHSNKPVKYASQITQNIIERIMAVKTAILFGLQIRVQQRKVN